MPNGNATGCGATCSKRRSSIGATSSYINADEFVSFLRSVAANAKGYAFKLALDHYAPSIAQQMETAASVVRDFNRYFGNSCQMAQGLVNNTLNAMGAANRTDASNAASSAASATCSSPIARRRMRPRQTSSKRN
jgi:hypothetical protein